MGSSLRCKSLVVVVVFVFGSVVYGQPWDGNGVDGDPYQIWTAADMQAIGADANYWDAHFELMADIDFSGYSGTDYNIIGYFVDEHVDEPFTGVFDGKGHKISSFIYKPDGTNYTDGGLFGYIRSGTIKELGLIAPHINVATTAVGSLIGYLDNGGVVIDCYVEGGSVSGDVFVGGLIGVNRGTVRRCYAYSNISGYYAGGLVGENYYGATSNCYSAGSVIGNYAGGLVGVNAPGLISKCYSTSWISGPANAGGLVGYDGGGSYVSCFWDSDVNPDVNGIGNVDEPNVTGKPTDEMQTESTFATADWDFVTPVWKICKEPDYPKLWWEGCPLEVEVKLTPQMLSCESKGKWFKAHVILPEGYWPEDIDVNTPAVAEPMEVESEYIKVFDNGKGKFGIEIGFDREAFCAVEPESEDEYLDVTVTGWLLTGQRFEGTDTIKVVNQH